MLVRLINLVFLPCLLHLLLLSFLGPSTSSSLLLSSQTPEWLQSTRLSRWCNSTGGPSSGERQENEHPRVNDQPRASSTDINMFEVLDSLDCEPKVTRAPPRNIPRIVQEAPEAPAGCAKKRTLCAGQVNSNTARVAGASSIVGFPPQHLEPENAS